MPLFFVYLLVEIYGDVMHGAFRIITNGGDGLKGQDGGDGVDQEGSIAIVSSLIVLTRNLCLALLAIMLLK